MALCSSFPLLMSGKEIRLCFEVLWWVEFGMVSYWVELGVSLFHVNSVVLWMVMVPCFGNVPFLLLRFVKILSFMIS